MIHYIYIPGFGDLYDPLRRLALKRWNTERTRTTFVPMRWNDRKETYEQRYERVAAAIKQAKGDSIVLIGESAGGAMAILAFSRQLRQVQRVVTICGYNHGATAVHSIHKHKRPGFYRMMPEVDRVVDLLKPADRKRIMTVYSARDRVVAPQYTRINGAREIIIHTPGHFSNIARVLLRRIPLDDL